jgi:hypothetical protein
LPRSKRTWSISATIVKPLIARWTTAPAGPPTRWPLRVWIIGDVARPEFKPSVEQIILHTQAVVMATVESIPDAEFDDEPDLCVLLAGRPVEFSHANVERIRYAAPLARIVGLLGAWCEGEPRTGHPWPAVPRIYLHRWQDWFQTELATLAAGRCGMLSLPLTLTEEERLLHAPGSVHGRHGLVAIHSPSRSMMSMLVEACAALGYDAVELSACNADSSPEVGIYDIAACTDSEFDELRGRTAEWPATRWIALAGFPRDDDYRRVLEAGATAIVSKPLLIDEFAVALARVNSRP